ncbi:unnamed protein product [Moneuplotes crassus]|uniref:Zinc finger PHD-type domain-containing protein n=1 Tax=Euplotes crassus TaxID=5936 RepID=A0AAD1Y8J3_EUPCR|nr:unnamed protein product [Moneuplotes crassus]
MSKDTSNLPLGQEKESNMEDEYVETTDQAQAMCEICFEIMRDPNPQCEEYKIIYCSKCLLPVHKGCYGKVDTTFEIKNEAKYENFICEICQLETPQECTLCFQSEGIMKKIKDEEAYIHSCCAILCDQYYISDFQAMEFTKVSRESSSKPQKKKSSKGKYSKKCILCEKEGGFLLECDDSTCNHKAHPFCIFKDNRESALLYSNDKEENSSWCIKYQSWSCKSLVKIDELFLDNDNCYYSPIERKGFEKRGGIVYVHCDIHRQPDLHCFCMSDAEYQKFMICCDYCNVWFHGICIGVSDHDKPAFDEFTCDKCKKWSNIKMKRKTLLQEDDEESLLKDLKSLIPLYNFRFGLLDHIEIASFWVECMEKFLESPKKYSITLFIELLRSCNRIPINLSTKIEELQKYVLSNLQVKSRSKEVRKLAKEEVLDPVIPTKMEANPFEVTICEDAEAVNNGLLKKLSKFYKKKRLPKSVEEYKVYSNYQQLETLDMCKKVFINNEKLEFVELEDLYRRLVASRYSGLYLRTIFNQIVECNLVKSELGFFCSKLNIPICFSDQQPEDVEMQNEDEPDISMDNSDDVFKLFYSKVPFFDLKVIVERAETMPVHVRFDRDLVTTFLTQSEEFSLEVSDPDADIEDLIQTFKKMKVVDWEISNDFVKIWEQNHCLKQEHEKFLSQKQIKYEEFEDFMVNIYPTTGEHNKELESEWKEIKALKKRAKALKSKKLKDLQKFLDKNDKQRRVVIPEIKDLRQRLVILKLMSESSEPHPSPTCSCLGDIEDLIKDLNSSKIDLKGINTKKARTIADLKLKYTRKVLKKFDSETLEGITQIVQTLHKDQGIITEEIYNKYRNWKQSCEWYEQCMDTIKNTFEQLGDFLTNCELLNNNLSSDTVKDYLKESSKIDTIIGADAQRLHFCLSRVYYKSLTSYDDDFLQKNQKHFEPLLRNDFEYAIFRDKSKVQEIFEKLEEDMTDQELVQKALELAFDTLPQSILAKLEETDQVTALIFKACLEIKNISENFKNEQEFSSELFELSYHKESTETEDESIFSTKLKILHNAISKCEGIIIPYESFWLNFAKSQYEVMNTWMNNYKKYTNWKEKIQNSMHSLITLKQDSYTSEKVRCTLLYPATEFLISPSFEVDVLQRDLKRVEIWIENAKFVSKKYNNSYKFITFSKEESRDLEEIFSEMKCLPCLSKENKDLSKTIYLLAWLSMAETIQNTAEGKKKYQEWEDLSKMIEPFWNDESISTSKIYKSFYSSFLKGKKLYRLYKGTRAKHKVTIDDFDKVLKDAKYSKIDLTDEIEQVCKKLITFNTTIQNFNKAKRTRENISFFQQCSKELNEYPFKDEEASESLKQIFESYSLLQSMIKSLESSFGNKPKIVKIKEFTTKYTENCFKFEEAENLTTFLETNNSNFEDAKKLFLAIMKEERPTWESLQEIYLKLRDLAYNYGKEQEIIETDLKSIKLKCFLETFKSQMKGKVFTYKISCNEVVELMQKYRSSHSSENIKEVKENLAIISKVEEYINTIKAKIEAITQVEDLEKFLKEGSAIVDYSDVALLKRKQLRNQKLKQQRIEAQKKTKKNDNKRRKKRPKHDSTRNKLNDDDWEEKDEQFENIEEDIAIDTQGSDYEEKPHQKKRDKKNQSKLNDQTSKSKSKKNPSTTPSSSLKTPDTSKSLTSSLSSQKKTFTSAFKRKPAKNTSLTLQSKSKGSLATSISKLRK